MKKDKTDIPMPCKSASKAELAALRKDAFEF